MGADLLVIGAGILLAVALVMAADGWERQLSWPVRLRALLPLAAGGDALYAAHHLYYIYAGEAASVGLPARCGSRRPDEQGGEDSAGDPIEPSHHSENRLESCQWSTSLHSRLAFLPEPRRVCL
jgi:hypothetical protein